METVAETDDDLLAKYLEEGAIGEPEMLEALKRAVASGDRCPCSPPRPRAASASPRCWSSHEGVPSPADRGAVEGVDPQDEGGR